MTANAAGVAPTAPSRVAGRLAGPRQGWSSLLLLLVMLAVTGLAIDEQHWMAPGLEGASQTAMLPVLMVAAGVTGAILALSRLSAGWIDLVAALLGTGAGLLFASGAISDAPSLTARLEALNDSLARFLNDSLVIGTQSSESSAFLLTVSALAWTSGVFAAISIFRRSNAAGAIVPLGAMLMLQVLASGRPQDIWLVLFAGASLLLVLRLDLESQRDGWLRRRIAGGQGVGGLYLRGGATVIGCMLVGSLLLANVAGTSSVATAFPQLDALVDDLAARVQGLVGVPAPGARGTNGEFPKHRSIQSSWRPSSDIAFIAEPLGGGQHYWRSASWDSFDGHGWDWTETTTQNIPAGEDLLDDSEDAVSVDSDHREAIATITSQTLSPRSQLPVPQNPVLLDRDARVSLMGEQGTFQMLDAKDELPVHGEYTVTGLEPAINELDSGLTINRLIAAGTDYPEWVEPFYEVKAGSVGETTVKAAAKIRGELKAKGHDDPYRLAEAIQNHLRTDPHFHYAVDTTCLSQETIPDCLLRTGAGFCMQYATTMTMMLRTLGVPARYVEGFLPGEDIGGGQFQVNMSAAHAWVEVWFPEVGWIPFDPTPGTDSLDENGQQATQLEEGPPIPTPGPSDDAGPDPSDGSFDPNATEAPIETAEPDASPKPDAGGGFLDDAGGGMGSLLLLGGLLAVVLLVAAGVLWLLRFPGRDPELAWRGIVGLATRLGAGPKPSQTPYEYTATLSRVVPTAARDLRVVADAKVDASYSAREGSGAEVRPLRDAYRGARRRLLRLLFRRGPLG